MLQRVAVAPDHERCLVSGPESFTLDQALGVDLRRQVVAVEDDRGGFGLLLQLGQERRELLVGARDSAAVLAGQAREAAGQARGGHRVGVLAAVRHVVLHGDQVGEHGLVVARDLREHLVERGSVVDEPPSSAGLEPHLVLGDELAEPEGLVDRRPRVHARRERMDRHGCVSMGDEPVDRRGVGLVVLDHLLVRRGDLRLQLALGLPSEHLVLHVGGAAPVSRGEHLARQGLAHQSRGPRDRVGGELDRLEPARVREALREDGDDVGLVEGAGASAVHGSGLGLVLGGDLLHCRLRVALGLGHRGDVHVEQRPRDEPVALVVHPLVPVAPAQPGGVEGGPPRVAGLVEVRGHVQECQADEDHDHADDPQPDQPPARERRAQTRDDLSNQPAGERRNGDDREKPGDSQDDLGHGNHLEQEARLAQERDVTGVDGVVAELELGVVDHPDQGSESGDDAQRDPQPPDQGDDEQDHHPHHRDALDQHRGPRGHTPEGVQGSGEVRRVEDDGDQPRPQEAEHQRGHDDEDLSGPDAAGETGGRSGVLRRRSDFWGCRVRGTPAQAEHGRSICPRVGPSGTRTTGSRHLLGEFSACSDVYTSRS